MSAITVGGTSASGLRWPNYVNGRLLTANDLEATQAATFTRDRWLGQAIGSGVVAGLTVSGGRGGKTLAVSAGLGVNPEGTALRLEARTTLDLAVVERSSPADGNRFADCRPEDIEQRAPSSGTYLLTMRPQTWFDGKVPLQGRAGALSTPCVSRWEVEGVVFRAVRLDRFKTSTTDENRRNLLAHWCRGSAHLEDLAMGAFLNEAGHRGTDRLVGDDLGPCDLPIAVFGWDGSTLDLVDQWSVRRRVAHPSAATTMPLVVSDELVADGEARFQQFEEHVAELIADTGGKGVSCETHFPWLPPSGLVPISASATASMLTTLIDGVKPTAPPPMVGTVEMMAPVALFPFFTAVEEDPFPFKEFKFAGGGLGAFASELTKVTDKITSIEKAMADLAAGIHRVEPKPEPEAGDQALAHRLHRLVELLAQSNSRGLDLRTFFDGTAVRLGVMPVDSVDFFLRRSWCDEAIDTTARPELDIYFVVDREMNHLAPYVLFTKHIRGVDWLTTKAGALPR